MRTVLMTAIPAPGADLGYVAYGRATWEWWCRRNGVEFVLLDRPVDDPALAGASPLIQRWRAAQLVLAAGPAQGQVAVVDADTMIRWDAPDFFALADGGFAAVPDPGWQWIHRSIVTYQRFFPDVRLDWWEYVNAGLVVVSPKQAPVLEALLDFHHRHRDELARVPQQDAGIDQTLLNFVVRERGEPVRLLPPPFNLTHCMPIWLYQLPRHDSAQAARLRQRLLDEALAVPGTLDFIEHSYVWHFNGPKVARAEFMRRTWETVRANYT
jgi:hypothetical protein